MEEPTQRIFNLKNEFYVLRHGQSEANVQGLIVSAPDLGVPKFGLTDDGQRQVKAVLESERNQFAKISLVYASDFRRARETAELVGAACNVPVSLASQLRERDFGQWEGRNDSHYKTVWRADAEDGLHKMWNVESVVEVAERMSGFVEKLDQSHRDERILLVSHGDPLQILIAAAGRLDLRQHRELKPLQTAELRRLESA